MRYPGPYRHEVSAFRERIDTLLRIPDGTALGRLPAIDPSRHLTRTMRSENDADRMRLYRYERAESVARYSGCAR
jgi:hypothetical protein